MGGALSSDLDRMIVVGFYVYFLLHRHSTEVVGYLKNLSRDPGLVRGVARRC